MTKALVNYKIKLDLELADKAKKIAEFISNYCVDRKANSRETEVYFYKLIADYKRY